MVFKKTYAAFLLAVFIFVFSFLCVPFSVHAVQNVQYFPTYSVTRTWTVSDSYTVTGLTKGYYYDVTFSVYFGYWAPAVSSLKAKSFSYTRLVTYSDGKSFVPSSDNGTYTVRFQAVDTSYKITVSGTFTITTGDNITPGVQLETGVSISGVSCVFATTGDPVLDELQEQTKIQNEQLEETKKQTEIAEEQKETTKGIFAKITDFFGSFFDNLIEMVRNLIVPSSDDLLAFLGEVNDWFGERLGFIWC